MTILIALFLFLKIFFSLLAAWAIYSGNNVILAVTYLLFITFDLWDSQLVKPGQKKFYRTVDTFGDRLFAYLSFFTFLWLQRDNLSLSLVYIPIFFARDLLILLFIVKNRDYSIKSNSFDRITMSTTALFFLAQVTETIAISNRFSIIASLLLTGLIIFQGFNKIKRITRPERA